MPGKDIVQYGFGTVTRLLLAHGLLDELLLAATPDPGRRRAGHLRFAPASAVGFDLADVTKLDDGIVIRSHSTARTRA